jgi:hypothetical protein
MESQKAENRRQQAFLADIERSCTALAVAYDSPILLGVTAAVAHLRALGCRADGRRCYVYVASDGVETVDEQMRKALTATAGRSRRH